MLDTLKRSNYYLPNGAAARGPFALQVTPQSAGWTESSLRIANLEPGQRLTLETRDDEYIVIPLAGSATVANGAGTFALQGRTSVFTGPSDFVYVGRDSKFTLSTEAGGRIALCGARAKNKLPMRYVAANDVAVELRGAGNCSREVRNFGTADAFEADSLIACEVVTPGGNWSSYPSHKHDEETEAESSLEEIYYFEISEADPGDGSFTGGVDTTGRGFGYQRVYGTKERPIEVLEEVRTGDAVLIPHGYHGPSVAAPGHHMYYLNVMAGPGAVRAWKITDDPQHTWIRGTWDSQDVDPRLPLRPNSGA
ncbi:5-deoxy-glucuronate isomerase [Hoyosella sp. YIM 151337]|uniref:5-deoxy-glucuronate isomerase n=1 Tax=Hoyosella sp. YIM 151337 TaxID=2992742 RepID=UPI00223654D3|nr:5-deoxy-glucuronate isomerase [Hoyosella sp. YIM 151337]MCW4352446.1 5-deoxy-glucuronate isomerase [Hoyosella sp. YIM 151337]